MYIYILPSLDYGIELTADVKQSVKSAIITLNLFDSIH